MPLVRDKYNSEEGADGAWNWRLKLPQHNGSINKCLLFIVQYNKSNKLYLR